MSSKVPIPWAIKLQILLILIGWLSTLCAITIGMRIVDTTTGETTIYFQLPGWLDATNRWF